MLTFSAWKPLGPLTTSNWTAAPSCRLRKPFDLIAEKCTNTSSPVWRLIKPKPLASLNHFTVPCSIVFSYFFVEFLLRRIAATERVTLKRGTNYQLRGIKLSQIIIG